MDLRAAFDVADDSELSLSFEERSLNWGSMTYPERWSRCRESSNRPLEEIVEILKVLLKENNSGEAFLMERSMVYLAFSALLHYVAWFTLTGHVIRRLFSDESEEEV
ncbi:hypothetical protein M422DRAFT_40536 [Sphaerobolus stellatus SS14]|nr:hypothetical protein M422DRAFT_40536 [Sphaerobolus stellatus SS14]